MNRGVNGGANGVVDGVVNGRVNGGVNGYVLSVFSYWSDAGDSAQVSVATVSGGDVGEAVDTGVNGGWAGVKNGCVNGACLTSLRTDPDRPVNTRV